MDLSIVYKNDSDLIVTFNKLNSKREKNNLIKFCLNPKIQKETFDKKELKGGKPQIPINLKYMIPIGKISEVNVSHDVKKLGEWGVYLNNFKNISSNDYKLLNNQKIISEIKGREIFVNYIDSKSNYAKVIKIYNQINSGGMKVEKEELAYSELVGLGFDYKLENPTRIKDIFDIINGDEFPDSGKKNIELLFKSTKRKSIRLQVLYSCFYYGCKLPLRIFPWKKFF